MKDLSKVKKAIILALSHPEAEEGLYFRNLLYLHEEDERPAVNASEDEVRDALLELLHDSKICTNGRGSNRIFFIPTELS